MKLEGIELVNFACFAKQYIPIQTGINLLVGKNNAGKTAVLRAVELLNGILLDRTPPKMDDVRGYQHDSGCFGMNVDYRIEPTDRRFITAENKEGLLDITNNPHFVYRLLIWPSISQAGLSNCTLVLESEERNLLDLENQPLLMYNPAADFRVDQNLRSHINSAIVVPVQGGQKIVSFVEETETLIAPLRQFHKRVVYIGPHRVIKSKLPLQTVEILSSDAFNLPQVLQTLHGKHRSKFQRIETFVTDSFPDFAHVNAENLPENQVGISLALRTTENNVPLNNCGTGVEQILTLATFLLTSPTGSIVLLDEPQSYLHPTAEKKLVTFLKTFPKHTIVISTHSSILINSVEATRIIPLPSFVAGGRPTKSRVASILLELGYQNSDLLFSDRLLLVEGPSDAAILPLLLAKSGVFSESQIVGTGFPVTDGGGRLDDTRTQARILAYEKLLGAIGRMKLPRLYVWDGDHNDKGQSRAMTGMKGFDGRSLPFVFLPVYELENYLLNPSAIAAAINEEGDMLGLNPRALPDEISTKLRTHLDSTEDRSLFPKGEKEDGFAGVKGSEVLRRIYDTYTMTYDKRRSGQLIARHLPDEESNLLSLANAMKQHPDIWMNL